MNNNYYIISFDNAKKFLMSLDDDKLKDLYDIYNIDTDAEKSLQDYVESLAATISDNDLYELGYVDNTESDDNDFDDDSPYHYDIEDVQDFLINLDEDVLDDLLRKYCATNVDDLAICITDAELMALGFDKIVVDQPEVSDDDYNPDDDFDYLDDYCEDYDFFEDVDYSIPIFVVDSDNLIFGTQDMYCYESLRSNLDSNLVRSCDIIPNSCDDNDIVLFRIIPIEYPEQIQEEVVINSELNPALFDNDTQKLKPEVKDEILTYVENLLNNMASKDIYVHPNDIQLIGSNAGYLYTPESDVDVHIITDQPLNKDNFEQLRAEFVDYTTSNPLDIDGYIVELNLEDGVNMEASAKRRYSILGNDWVDDSNTEEVYTVEDLAKVDGYEDVVDDYSKRIDDVISSDSYAEAVALKQEIRSNRSEDLANIGSLSMGNVVFKELRNNGKFGELREFIKNKELDASDPIDDGSEDKPEEK